jgi:hypothetical protein
MQLKMDKSHEQYTPIKTVGRERKRENKDAEKAGSIYNTGGNVKCSSTLENSLETS